MKNIYKTGFFVLLASSLVFTACKKDYFDELNQNPNQVTKPTLAALLATSTSKMGINSYTVAANTAPYVQYTANPTANAASDIYETIDFSGMWDAIYFAMADLKQLKAAAIEESSSEYIGAANVMLAYNLNLANDLWGDIPYSEAFDPKNFYPKYDNQQAVYTAALALLDEAIVELSKTDATVKLNTASDLIYGATGAANQRANWLKLAQGLKARMLIKVSKTNTFSAANVLDAVSKSFVSNADDAGMATFPTRNNWATVARNNASLTLGGWLSEQFIDHLNGKTYGILDPRIKKITDLTVNGVYIGTTNGAGNKGPGNNTIKDENYIAISSPWTSDTSPLLIMTFAELKFIEAEAAFNTDKTRAYNAYLAGIAANMDKLQVPAAEKAVYLADPSVAVGAAALTKELIFKEKYIATYLNPEAFNDVRRNNFNYKDFTLPVGAVLPSFIRRLDYPLVAERNKNGANVPNDPPRTTRLWWDQ
ncbi:MAG: SusD/RagB family nutrient-binding outer membrane lipoprotein [Pedobacter sp.]|nr:MAG: SusD/RagB family nutrient-binding outer membrane lipoprotein [Pedobacter sp.]